MDSLKSRFLLFLACTMQMGKEKKGKKRGENQQMLILFFNFFSSSVPSKRPNYDSDSDSPKHSLDVQY